MLPESSSEFIQGLEEKLKEPKWFRAAWIGAAVLGLVFSLIAWQGVSPISPDGACYLIGADSLIEQGTYDHPSGKAQVYFPPGYPILIAAVGSVIGDLEVAGRVVSLLVSTLSIVVVFFLMREFGSDLLAASSAGLFAILAQRVRQSVMIWSEPMFMLLVLLMVLTGIKWLRTKQWYWALMMGAASGAAYITRPEGFILVFFTLGVFFIGSRERLKLLPGAVAAIIGFLIFAWPFISYVHRATGEWMVSDKTGSNLAKADEVVFGQGRKRLYEIDEYGRMQPHQMAANTAKRVAFNLGQMIPRLARTATPFIFAFAGLGLVSLFWREKYRSRRLGPIYFLLTLALPMAYLAVFFFWDRYLIHPSILIVILGAAGALHLIDLFRGEHARWAGIIVAVVLVGSMVVYNVPWFFGPGTAKHDAVRKRAEWISQHYPDADVIAAREPYLAYLTGMDVRGQTRVELDELVQSVKENDADLVLLPRKAAYESVSTFVADPPEDHMLRPVKEWNGLVLFEVRD